MTLQSIAILLACALMLIPDGMFSGLWGKIRSMKLPSPEAPKTEEVEAPAAISRETALRYLDEIAAMAPDCCRQHCETIAVEIVKRGFAHKE